jgi:hypothetical protein
MKAGIKENPFRFIRVLIISALCFVITNESIAGPKPRQNSDSLNFIALTGKVLDKETRKPIMFASISLNGTNIGTVANADGEFLLKVPKSKVNEQVSFSHLGYKNSKMSAESLKGTEAVVYLEPETIALKEVIIRSEDPVILLKGALSNVPKNYRTEPVMLTSFYRETIQQNKKYVSVAEGVLEAYKSAYNSFSNDKVKVLIGRKGQDVKKMDTVVVKLQGGPITPFFLDIVKNPENVLSEDYFKYYDYTLAGQVSIDDIRCYVIEFNQKKDVDMALYKGKIYIEMDNLAIVGAEFDVSENGLPQANVLFVKKKPLTMKVDILRANYFVRYTKNSGKWGLNYVRSELKFKCKWQKRFFTSTYATMVEMAVTDIDTVNVNKFNRKETIKSTDIFSDRAEDFKNDEFWGDYNIIKPDESIQSAILKLSKKLKKK